MKILLTGSSGFIGQSLSDALASTNHELILADKITGTDLTDKNAVDNLPDVDLVIHMAAQNGTDYFYSEPLNVIRNSVLPTQYLIDRYAGKIKRFIFTSSCESYAGAVDLFDWEVPTSEDVPLVVSDVTNPRWSYGGSKIINELQVLAAYHQLNQPYTIIRYHNVYGPNQTHHVIPDFIEKVKLGNFILDGWDNTRSFMYISDAINATLAVIFSDACANQILHIGVNDEITIQRLAEIILEEMNISGKLILNPAPIGSVKRRCANVTKLSLLTGFKPTVQLRDGIREILK
jgi:nucleoside-diphosphate-sugar epimerase